MDIKGIDKAKVIGTVEHKKHKFRVVREGHAVQYRSFTLEEEYKDAIGASSWRTVGEIRSMNDFAGIAIAAVDERRENAIRRESQKLSLLRSKLNKFCDENATVEEKVGLWLAVGMINDMIKENE